MLAQVIEWVSLLRAEQIALLAKKGTKVPDVYHVRRPYETDDEANNVIVMTPREFARMTA